MPVLRVLFAVLDFAVLQPALAQDYWDPAECEMYMIDHVEHLEDDVRDIEDLLVRIAEAERKGETERAANFRTILHSKRVDGIQSMLRRIDTQEYVHCNKALFDPALIARVDAARPYAEETEVTVAAVEEVPKIAVTGIGTTFVPYETYEGGGCKGPFLDLAINIANTGGVYPRPVDLERRAQEYPTVDWRTKPFMSLTVLIDWGYGGGYAQEVIPLPWEAFEGGTFASGATMTVPYRLFIPSDKASVKLGGLVSGASFLVVDGTAAQSATYETEASIPIWDVYTQSAQVVTSRDRDDKYKIKAVIKADIVNLGDSPLPGWASGNFTVRDAATNRRLVTISGTSFGLIAERGAILGETPTNEIIKGKIMVDSGVTLLCPDGTGGTLSDGNTSNNIRTLEGTG